jgi:hypothetical protein
VLDGKFLIAIKMIMDLLVAKPTSTTNYEQDDRRLHHTTHGSERLEENNAWRRHVQHKLTIMSRALVLF